MKFAVAGLGYVGLANAVMLSEKFPVSAFDIDTHKVISTNDKYGKFRINATTDGRSACRDADFVIVATPTDFDEDLKSFDTSSVESVVSLAANANPGICVVIKSTVPVGFTKKLICKTGYDKIIFSPEFLREGNGIYDCFNPSRIIIGADEKTMSLAEKYRDAILGCARKKDTAVMMTGTDEAEAIKLFSNSYLAVRVAFFNELDTFAEEKGMNTADIVKGVSLDPRIGDFYNNPSFGYGGYCLPKDTKQLLSQLGSLPQSMFSAVVDSNEKRMDYIADSICSEGTGVIGIYRLSMKSGSDNFRSSAVLGILKRLRGRDRKVVVYEPMVTCDSFDDIQIVNDLEKFKKISELIVANRYSKELEDVKEKVYTRDLFFRD